jgi:hypothetical protein
MSGYAETMRLKEMAEEDIYFAKRDRELKAALRQRREQEQADAARAQPEKTPSPA